MMVIRGSATAGCTSSLAHGEGQVYLESITLPDGVGIFTNVIFTQSAACRDRMTGSTAITIDNVTNNTSEFGY